MGFAPIKLQDYVRLHLRSNRGDKADEVTALLKSALAKYKAGARCQCGEPIWVIGSAFAGNMCFTCITGEADPSDDYEIVEACDKHHVRLSDPAERAAAKDPGFDQGSTDDEVPF